MTGSELFEFLRLKKELEDDIKRVRKEMPQGLTKEALAWANLSEEFVKKLDDLLYVINPPIPDPKRRGSKEVRGK